MVYRVTLITRSTGTLELLIVAFRLSKAKTQQTLRFSNQNRLVPEMPHPGEDHGQAEPVGSFDDLLVAY